MKRWTDGTGKIKAVLLVETFWDDLSRKALGVYTAVFINLKPPGHARRETLTSPPNFEIYLPTLVAKLIPA